MEEIKKEDLSLVPTADLLKILKERWSPNFFFAALENNVNPPYSQKIPIIHYYRGAYDNRLAMLHSLKIRIFFYLGKFHNLHFKNIE